MNNQEHSVQRGFGSASIAKKAEGILKGDMGPPGTNSIVFGLSPDGMEIMIQCTHPVTVLTYDNATQILESFRMTLRQAHRIQIGEITVTKDPGKDTFTWRAKGGPP